MRKITSQMSSLLLKGSVVNKYFISHIHLCSQFYCKSYDRHPLQYLNQLCDQQLLHKNENIFSPSETDVSTALKLFSHNARHPIVSHKGVVHMENLPVLPYPEVTFAGRSNCGKSSLMKYIFKDVPNLKLLAVSKTPGHTKVLKFIQVGKNFTLVDQPGYGENMPRHYVRTVEEYLKIRKNLKYVFLLIDCHVGICDVDKIGIEMMEESGKPYAIVFTKIDMLSHHALIHKVVELQRFFAKEKYTNYFPQPFLISSHSGSGVEFLQTFIAYVTRNMKMEFEKN